MPQEITKRHAIIEALCASRTAKEIIDFFNYNKDLVYRIKKQFEACDDPETFTGERGKPTSDILMPSGALSLSLKSSRGFRMTPPSLWPPWPSK